MREEYTVKTFSAALNVEEDKGRGLLYFLEAAGLADNLGARKAEGAKGKGPTYYALKPNAPEKVAAILAGLRG